MGPNIIPLWGPLTKKSSTKGGFSVSAEGIEYHPPVGTLNKKSSTKGGFSVSAEGIEPSTNGLKGRCSTIELRAHSY